jgi:hypothetical protein
MASGARFIEQGASLFDLPVPFLSFRPGPREPTTIASQFMAPTDVVGLMIWLRYWGLPVDPGAWVQALRPSLLKRNLLTEGELRVYWYPREWRRMRRSLDHVTWPDNALWSFTTAGLRRIERQGNGARTIPTRRHRPDGRGMSDAPIPPSDQVWPFSARKSGNARHA